MTPLTPDTTATLAVRPLETPPGRSSTRKLRSDAGIAKGPLTPRLAPLVTLSTMDGIGVAMVALSGIHGTGRTLLLDRDDWTAIAATFDDGRRIQVVQNGRKDGLTVYLEGPAAAAWAGNSNPRHIVTLGRYIAADKHRGHLIRVRNGNPFDLRRANMEIEVRATRQRYPIRQVDAVTA